MKVRELLKECRREMESSLCGDFAESEEILMHLLKLRNRSDLYSFKDNLPDSIEESVSKIIKGRKKSIPLQYLTGAAVFYGLDFKVCPGVFIPRPETELLVEYVINNYRDKKGLSLLEIGTGSGAVAVTLANFMPDCRITATDINLEALSLAEENASLNKCRDRIDFVGADLLGAFSGIRFDLIVANPPYVAEIDFKNLQQEVREEPESALLGGPEGVEFSLRLIAESRCFLSCGGKIILEIGAYQEEKYIRNLGDLYRMEFLRDYHGYKRVMILELV